MDGWMHVKSPEDTAKHYKIRLFAQINRTIIELLL